ncbi:hypothetical protein FRX31_005845 [Thalictrum thalictroides]|uniref:Pentatricopeptide repeat-containing protein n=1 Tax=Thalictrum thalictroides TaxID=46969 RepID=A0A7J6X680_THATH|nr:hypothetical protein FRX31_005845 [Thalictrum thalictroides]
MKEEKHIKRKQISTTWFFAHISYLSINSKIVGKKTQSAFFVFNDVKELIVCNSLVAGLASDGYIDSAKKVFDEMCVRGNFGAASKVLCGLPPDYDCHVVLLKGLKQEPIVQLICAMMEKSFIPYNPTWMGLCDGLSIKRC